MIILITKCVNIIHIEINLHQWVMMNLDNVDASVVVHPLAGEIRKRTQYDVVDELHDVPHFHAVVINRRGSEPQAIEGVSRQHLRRSAFRGGGPGA